MKKVLTICALLVIMCLPSSCVATLDTPIQEITYYSEYVYLGNHYPIVLEIVNKNLEQN